MVFEASKIAQFVSGQAGADATSFRQVHAEHAVKPVGHVASAVFVTLEFAVVRYFTQNLPVFQLGKLAVSVPSICVPEAWSAVHFPLEIGESFRDGFFHVVVANSRVHSDFAF